MAVAAEKVKSGNECSSDSDVQQWCSRASATELTGAKSNQPSKVGKKYPARCTARFDFSEQC